MYPLIQFKTTTQPLLITFVLACFGLSPASRAVLPPPPPDGGYPNQNTAEGDGALFSLTTGQQNTAVGFQSLVSNTTGDYNTANGVQALASNIDGSDNTANGVRALFSNTTGDGNTANGFEALKNNTTSSGNTANGYQALHDNTTGGNFNTANGSFALQNNTTGFSNTANGAEALDHNTTGFSNTASGVDALFHNIAGNHNTAIGTGALASNTSGSSNIAVGDGAGSNLTTGDNNIEIGNDGVAAEVDTIRIGTQGTQTRTFIAGINETPIGGGGSTVRVNANGQLGTAPSSARFKQNIKPMDKTSEAIHELKPVTFRYKQEIDPEGVPQFGLVAEDVAKVNPDLVVCAADGKVYTVRYEAVNAMLLNEFLKEHRIVQELKKEVANLTATVKEQASEIQKVNTRLDGSKPAPEMVINN